MTPHPLIVEAEEAQPDKLRQLFRETFRQEPEGIFRAPGRINLIGEHVDYNAGRCMPMALEHSTFLIARRRSDGLLRATTRLSDSGLSRIPAPVTVPLNGLTPERLSLPVEAGWARYVIGVLWALIGQGHEDVAAGMDLLVVGNIPLGAGLSSSAALTCSTALACSELFGLGLSDDHGRTVLAQAAVTAENEMAGAATGGMDQAISLRGSAGHLMLLDCQDFSTRQIPFDADGAGLSVLVIDTQAPHRLVDGQYAERRSTCERAAASLGLSSLREAHGKPVDEVLAGLHDDVSIRRTRHVLSEMDRVDACERLLDEHPLNEIADRIGELISGSHRSLRDDYQVSCPELDTAVDAAMSAGALGARMIGGGFGGSAIALIRRTQLDDVVQAVSDGFVRHRFTEPRFLLARPADGARRLA
ncbi:galactokinase [Saxibacter everestensis]|uniref:Galactokinase n=1 Tax=Saxibacter everestensis TaxID=2909229 RepID=A0ABY8QRY5_9MICO|nr:galactokinase [Brevibacteriaceae bacterium ZFBP1038]